MPETDSSGVRIYLEPSLIWKFFSCSHNRLQSEMVLIAENIDTKYAVYVDEDNGVLRIHVCKGDSAPEYTQVLVNEDQCAEIATHVYRQYLFSIIIADSEPVEEDDYLSQQDMKDMQYEREDELRLAMMDFLSVALGSDLESVMIDLEDGQVEDILDHILQYLAEEHGVSVWRPMFVENEQTGVEEFCEYPYANATVWEADEISGCEDGKVDGRIWPLESEIG